MVGILRGKSISSPYSRALLPCSSGAYCNGAAAEPGKGEKQRLMMRKAKQSFFASHVGGRGAPASGRLARRHSQESGVGKVSDLLTYLLTYLLTGGGGIAADSRHSRKAKQSLFGSRHAEGESLPERHAVAPPSHASPSKPNPPLRLHAWPQIPAEVEFLPQLQPKRRSPKPLPLPSEGTWDASCKMDDRCIPYYDALTDRHNRYVRTQSFRKHYQGYLEMRSDARIARSHSLATKLFRASVGELHSSSAPHLPVAGMGGLPNLEVATVITPPTPTRTHTHPHPPTPTHTPSTHP